MAGLVGNHGLNLFLEILLALFLFVTGLPGQHHPAKEDEHVQDADKYLDPGIYVALNKIIDINRCLGVRNPLGLQGKDHHQQDLHIREHERKYKKEGIHQVNRRKHHGEAYHQIHEQRCSHVQQHAQYDVAVKTELSPYLFHNHAKGTDAVDGKGVKQDVAHGVSSCKCRRIYKKGQNPPDLPMHDGNGV